MLHRMENRYLTMRKPDYQAERDGRFLLVWGDIPQWVIVDGELLELFWQLDGTKQLSELLGTNKSLPIDIAGYFNMLLKKGVLLDIQSSMRILPDLDFDNLPIENISINLTRKCNLRCRFCYNLDVLPNDASTDLSSHEIISFLKSIKKYLSKNPTLAILGGEPTIFPDKLFDIAAYSIRNGFNTLVSTNGILINDNFSIRARNTALQVQVSIDGHNAELNDPVRGNGTFEKIVKGIKILVRNDVHTIISMVCHSGNIEYLEDFYRFAELLGVNEARFIPLKQIGGAQHGEFTPVSTKDMIVKAYNMLCNNPGLVKFMGRDALSIMANTCRYSIRKQSCGTGLQTLLLDSDGSIYPCLNNNVPEFKAANIRDASFEFHRVWKNSLVLRNIRKQTAVNNVDAKCAQCPVRYWCLGGCHGETYSITGSLTAVPPGCHDMHDAIIEILWMLGEKPDLAKLVTRSC
ncbi:MAG: radical SAM protein [Armatimonadota bacterium]